jgi:hypothetical protein
MNKLLKEFLSYILVEETPAEKAKKMGLTSAGFGRWKNDQGVVTHKTDGDNLAPVTSEEPDLPTGKKKNGEKVSPPETGGTEQPDTAQPATAADITPGVLDPDKSNAPVSVGAPATQPGYEEGKSAASAEITGEVTNHPTAKNEDGSPLEVRYIIDENGNAVDTSTEEGRKTAVRIINGQLERMRPTTIQACQDFKGNIQAQKWLGEIGELHALREILETGREAYLLKDSNKESDIAIIDERTGDEKKLKIIQISVKSSIGEKFGKRGANARAIILAMVRGKTSNFDPNLGDVPAEVAIDSIYDIREGLGYFISDDIVVKVPGKKTRELELTPEKLDRCTPEYRTAYEQDAVINGKRVRENQALFERSRLITTDDLDEYEEVMMAKIDEENKSSTPEEIAERKRLAKFYLDRLRQEVADAPNGYNMQRLQAFILNNMGEVNDNTDPPSDAIIQSDLVGLQFNAQTGVPKVTVAKAQDIRDCIEAREREKTGETSPTPKVPTSGGRMKWADQFSRFITPVWANQGRVSKRTGRGNIQFKLNWAPDVDCAQQNSSSVRDYLG